MHYTINYSGMSKQEKHAKAYQDAVNYIGLNKVEPLINCMVAEFARLGKRKGIRFCSHAIPMLAGISGPPASAMIRVALQRFNNLSH